MTSLTRISNWEGDRRFEGVFFWDVGGGKGGLFW